MLLTDIKGMELSTDTNTADIVANLYLNLESLCGSRGRPKLVGYVRAIREANRPIGFFSLVGKTIAFIRTTNGARCCPPPEVNFPNYKSAALGLTLMETSLADRWYRINGSLLEDRTAFIEDDESTPFSKERFDKKTRLRKTRQYKQSGMLGIKSSPLCRELKKEIL